ncbi:MAG: DUF3307 domain-containing protein [Halanaerobiales bacterium]
MLLSLFILAHILTDFTFQSGDIARGKYTSFSKLLKHLMIYFFITLILTAYVFSSKLLLLISVFTVLHGLIDFLKIKIERRYSEKLSLELLFVDQIIHILIFLIFYPIYSTFSIHPYFIAVHNYLQDLYPYLSTIDYNNMIFVIATLTIVIFNFKGSNIIVGKVLKKYKANYEESENSKGWAIGNLERILVILFVLLNNYALIGLLFTAKSLIRFKEVEESKAKNQNFVEYYLIGTFTSLLIAIISGLVINLMI